MSLHFRRLSPAVGAQVLGVSLREPLTPPIISTLHKALAEHGVLFFRQQEANDGDLVSFAQHFGPLEGPHPVYSPDPASPIAVIKHDENNPPDGAEYHTDCSWSNKPPPFSVLWPKILPDVGGDTLWLSSSIAFDKLPTGMQNDLRKLNAIHDMGSFRNGYAKISGAAGINEGHAKFGCAIHPVVTTHPVTGRECLFVNECFTHSIEGLMIGESRRLLNYLFDHLSSPDLSVRWRWEMGDVVLWDNRGTQHYATADFQGRREMSRVTVIRDTHIESRKVDDTP